VTNQIDSLINEARTYLGVPWRHQGRSKKGVDCVGIILLAYLHIGVKINEIKGYSRKPDGFALRKIMDEEPNFMSVRTPYRAGDVVLFRIRKDPQHIALLTGEEDNLYMIHSFNGGEKKVVEHSFADYWKQKIVSVYRLK